MEQEYLVTNTKLRSEFNGRKRYYVFLTVMLAMVFARLALDINIPVSILLIISLYPIFICDTSEQFAYIVSCIPLSKTFQYRYALLICAIVFLFRNRGKIKLTRITLIVLVMMLWEFLHSFYWEFSFIGYFQCFAELIILIFVSSAQPDEIDYKLVIRSLSISVVGVCLIMLYLQLSQHGFSLTEVFTQGFNQYRFGINNTNAENFGLNFNPNELGFICNLSASGILVLCSRHEHNLLDVILLVCSNIFGIVTLSRTAILCMCLMYILYLAFIPGNLKRRILGILGITIIVGMAVIMINRFIPGVIQDIVGRFSESDITSGRTSLFSYYHDFIWSNMSCLLFGVGIQYYGEKVASITGIARNVCHNVFQEAWVVWGFLGIVIVVAMLIEMVRTNINTVRQNRVQFIPFLLLIVDAMAGQFITSETTLLALSFVFICLQIQEWSENKTW